MSIYHVTKFRAAELCQLNQVHTWAQSAEDHVQYCSIIDRAPNHLMKEKRQSSSKYVTAALTKLFLTLCAAHMYP